MKSSKAQIYARFHKIPMIRFEDQRLTSFSGLLIFQALFTKMKLKRRLKRCSSHLKISPIFGRHLVALLLIVHLLLGFRRLHEIDYYSDDPLVRRLLGLRKLSYISKVSRAYPRWNTMECISFANCPVHSFLKDLNGNIFRA